MLGSIEAPGVDTEIHAELHLRIGNLSQLDQPGAVMVWLALRVRNRPRSRIWPA